MIGSSNAFKAVADPVDTGDRKDFDEGYYCALGRMDRRADVVQYKGLYNQSGDTVGAHVWRGAAKVYKGLCASGVCASRGDGQCVYSVSIRLTASGWLFGFPEG